MDSKKHFASLLEDHSPDPGPATFLRPLSPFRNGVHGRRPGTSCGDEGGSTCTTPSHTRLDIDLTQDRATLSCVYVSELSSSRAVLEAYPGSNRVCRAKETSLEDCARHRFIVWAAVKRN